MSARGREFFDEYVVNSLSNAELAALTPEGHAMQLLIQAHIADISLLEITEEVGPLADAVAVAMNGHDKDAKDQKRPADVNGIAVSLMRIATGEEADDGKDPAAKALGAKGGRKRAENMTPERRAEIARKAAAKRWEK